VISRAAPEFWQLYGKLSPEIQFAARKAYLLFSAHPSHPSLRLERLRADPPHGQFAFQESFALLLCGGATNGCGFGLARTKSSTGAFHVRPQF
jgi:hypothetical protein